MGRPSRDELKPEGEQIPFIEGVVATVNHGLDGPTGGVVESYYGVEPDSAIGALICAAWSMDRSQFGGGDLYTKPLPPGRYKFEMTIESRVDGDNLETTIRTFSIVKVKE